MNRLLSAFRNSWAGLVAAFRMEWPVRVEVIALAASLPVAAIIADDIWTFAAMIGAVLFVLTVELLNTGIEKLCDHVMPDHHADIGLVKDLASAAVLISLVVAILIWGAAIWRWLSDAGAAG